MRILAVADEESRFLWDFFDPEYTKDVDVIISCGDVKPEYLSFLTTMCRPDVYYVHGNHDRDYLKKPPEGCISLEDQITLIHGYRVLGLGGSIYYSDPRFQYTEEQMRRRVSRLRFQLKKYHGFDILVTHAAPAGHGDDTDPAHRGFEVFNELIKTYQPKAVIHGHVHMNYGYQIKREEMFGSTRIINAYEKYKFDIE